MERLENLPQIIALEGGDGVGKTTLAKHLATTYDYTYIKTPGKEFKTLRPFIEKNCSPETRLLYYLSSVFAVSDQINVSLGNRYVIDRYIWSTITGYLSLTEQELSPVLTHLEPLMSKLIQPDLIVLLECDFKTQQYRIQSRAEDVGRTDRLTLQPGYQERISNLYHSMVDDNWQIINNTTISVEETARHALFNLEVQA